ncbi:MAG TPA: FAD-dependent oxidoreductase [Nitrolancea sp.]|jgi:sarcosine oxidase subunit beta|nr:FAD-dependent oxidoreductase [Nitrolancea sp.]
MAERADVVIIGGGIMGTSLAYGLTQLGVRDVLVIERRTLAAGASGRTGALLRQHYTNVPEATLAHMSLQTYANWDDVIGGDCGFVRTGAIVTVSTSGDDAVNIERMQRNIAMQNRVGIASEVISAERFRELQPFTRVDDVAVAAYERDSGYVDAVAATRGMAEAAVRGGARIAEGLTVTGILTGSDGVTGVETNAGPIYAKTVVCAAGAWSVPLLQAIGIEVPVEAQRVQVAILSRPLEMPEDGTMTYVDTAAGFFCRNAGPNRTLAGVGGGEFHNIVNPFDYDDRMDPGFDAAVKASLALRMPAMAHATTLYGYACLYDMTPDLHPILGSAEGPDGLFLMLGFCGAGFKKGPAIGRCMAELIVEGQSTTVDLTPFRLGRYSSETWQDPWSPDEYSLSSDFGHKF